jgi:hypothetical protein
MENLKLVFKSWRFWGVVLGAVSKFILDVSSGKDILASLMEFIQIVVAGAVAIRTFDRASEKIGQIK